VTLSARTELSHSYSFDSKIDAIFKITLVAEKRTEAKGFHHIIVLDTSKSMDGQKIELAKNGAQAQSKPTQKPVFQRFFPRSEPQV